MSEIAPEITGSAPEKFALYFSHSWDREYVDLNLRIWELIHSQCGLMVDKPGQDLDPAYYINRLEELLRRSDLFLAVLPYKEHDIGASPMFSEEDAGLFCSPWSLFEIRLAERANRPRLILYDARTGFQPPEKAQKHACYVERIISEGAPLENEREFREQLADWLKWADDNVWPGSHTRQNNSLVLLPEDLPDRAEVMAQISAALKKAKYLKPVDLIKTFKTDAELFRQLSGGGLLVADVSSLEHLWVYCVAHAMFIPSIRLLRTHDGEPPKEDKFGWILERLPGILKGHPGGYQFDTICWQKPQDLGEVVTARARATLTTDEKITSYEVGKRFFERRRYGTHRVFISHDLPQDDRELINAIMARLDYKSVNYFEYVSKNDAGEEWEERLKAELDKSTHFLLLLTDGYEKSPACVDEIEFALRKNEAAEKKDGAEKKATIKFIPFMLGGRTEPHVKIRRKHHKLLDSDPQTNAEEVAGRVIKVLLGEPVS